MEITEDREVVDSVGEIESQLISEGDGDSDFGNSDFMIGATSNARSTGLNSDGDIVPSTHVSNKLGYEFDDCNEGNESNFMHG